MNKNAYEIRLDIMRDAMSYAMGEYDREWSVWNTQFNEGKTTAPAPKYPGLKEILGTAEELYKFVENK
jgi:hypothetical protein